MNTKENKILGKEFYNGGFNMDDNKDLLDEIDKLDDNEESVKEKALNNSNVLKHIVGKNIIKVIVVPNKIVNIVIK